MGQTFTDFKSLYGCVKGLTNLNFVFSPFRFGHLSRSGHDTFNKFFGFKYAFNQITDGKFKDHKIIEIQLDNFLEKFNYNVEEIRSYLSKSPNTIYSFSAGNSVMVTHPLWESIFSMSNGEWLRNPILKEVFAHKQAADFRNSIKNKSLFKNKENKKLLIHYRLGDISLYKSSKGVYCNLYHKSYNSWQEAVEARKKTPKPFIEVGDYLNALKKYKKTYPNASVALISDGFPQNINETKEYLKPLLDYCEGNFLFGEGEEATVTSILSIFEADNIIFGYKGFSKIRLLFCPSKKENKESLLFDSKWAMTEDEVFIKA